MCQVGFVGPKIRTVEVVVLERTAVFKVSGAVGVDYFGSQNRKVVIADSTLGSLIYRASAGIFAGSTGSIAAGRVLQTVVEERILDSEGRGSVFVQRNYPAVDVGVLNDYIRCTWRNV